MAGVEVIPPFQVFTDVDGTPLEAGFIFIGQVNQNPEVTPVSIFWDQALTIPAAQPVRTIGGYPSRNGTPSKLFVSVTTYSILIKDRKQDFIYSDLNSQSSTDLEARLVDASNIANGATLVGYKGRTARAKLNNSVNVLDDNGSGAADPTGVSDSTAAFLAAVNLGTGSVYVPAGTYLLNLTSMPSGIMLWGDGKKTIIKPLTPEVRAAIAINSGSATTFIDDLTFYNLTFQGSVVANGFSEQKHLLTLNGVRNALVYRCWFLGFRGDGLYIGSGDAGGEEKHNHNVQVISCYFDGENKDNRNAISVIDGDGIIIANNYFIRCTKSTMPGAIDIEPDSAVFHVIRRILIKDNQLVDIGGNVAAIAIHLPGIAFTTAPSDFRIEGNHLNNVQTGYHFNYNIAGGVTESNVPHSVVFRDNVVQTAARPFNIINVHNVILANNRHLNCNNAGLLGFNTGNEHVIDALLHGNMFYKCGQTGGTGLSVFKATRLTLSNNLFNDCGTGIAGAANAIDFDTGTSINVAMESNSFISPTGKTLVAIQKEAAHTFTANTNSFYGNDVNGLTNNFQFTGNEAAVPSYAKEGASFTPVASGATTAGAATYSVQQGFNTKIGKLISFSIQLAWTGHTGTGQLLVSLPENVNASEVTFRAASLISDGLSLAAGAQAQALVSKDNNRLQIYTTNAGVLASFSVPASGTLYISGEYLAA